MRVPVPGADAHARQGSWTRPRLAQGAGPVAMGGACCEGRGYPCRFSRTPPPNPRVENDLARDADKYGKRGAGGQREVSTGWPRPQDDVTAGDVTAP